MTHPSPRPSLPSLLAAALAALCVALAGTPGASAQLTGQVPDDVW